MIWVGGVRVSTIVMAVLLLTAAIARHDWRGLLATTAWFFGFETAWQSTNAITYLAGHGMVAADLGWISAGVGWTLAAHLAGVRVNWPFVLLTAALWVVWLLQGFHANYPHRPFDPLVEVINESAKTAWGLAYLVPLLPVDLALSLRPPRFRFSPARDRSPGLGANAGPAASPRTP